MRGFFLPFALLLLGCATARPEADIVTFANPVLDEDFPDPAILTLGERDYYAYATQSGGRNIQVARSPNLVDWRLVGDALPVKPAWASRTQDFWAPHVVRHGGIYYLYYSAKPDAAIEDRSRGLCLAVATASRPEGPFTDSGKPLQCGPGFVNIDPMPYDDPATGKRLLYWGSGFGPIKVRELAEDRMSFAPGSVPIDLVSVVQSDDPAQYQRLVEGAWVIRRRGYYYLFYSGDNCCGPNAHYAVMVARSRSATGPFGTPASAKGVGNSVVLERKGKWVAPGHNSIVEDEDGTLWMLYHAVDSGRPRARESDEVNTRRIMLIDPIVWEDGWPRVDGPSEAPRRRPSVR